MQHIELTGMQLLVLSWCLIVSGALIPDEYLARLRLPAAFVSLGLVAWLVSSAG